MNSFFHTIQWISTRCLDVVIIALLWQEYLGQVLEVEMFGYERIVLGLSVWLVYVGDRWLDVKRIQPDRLQSLRHKFIAQNLRVFKRLFWAALIIDVLVAFIWMPWDRIFLGFGVLALAAIYTFLSARRGRGGLPKEIQAAIIFGFGIFIFVFEARLFFDLAFWGHFIFLVLLLIANSGLISHWECFIDVAQGQESLAQRWTRSYHAFTTLALLSGVGGALTTYGLFDNPFLLISPYFIAGLGLWSLHFFCKRLGAERLHELADLCLFSPIIALIVLYL